MDYLDRYKAMNTPYGTSIPEHTRNFSIDAARRFVLNSPTLYKVTINETETQAIVSNYQRDYFDRTFLLEPESPLADIGNYVKYRNYTYLIMKTNDDDIYPNLYGKLCNDTFLVPIETRKIPVVGSRGTTYKYEYVTKEVPIVVDVKGYSIADNAILPLAEGRIVIYMQYQPNYIKQIPLNHQFNIFNDEYKITDIQLDKVINEKGYIVLSAQKVSETNVTT